MEQKALQNIFIKMLRAELVGEGLDEHIKAELTPQVVSDLYLMSKRHDLVHILSSCLYENNVEISSDMLKKLQHEEMLSIYRHERMAFALETICHAFDNAKIPYILLKGAILREYYPKATMRTSCDIDVLVKPEDHQRAIDVLVPNGFTLGEAEYHDVSLFSPSGVHLELHFNIQENIVRLDSVLKKAWEYATPAEGYRYEFSKEFFLCHVYAHISYHFLSGGCGIRSLMDAWIMEHKMGISFRDAEPLLDKAGIYRFAEEFSDLAEICFSGKERNDFSDVLLSYIFDGGIYGTRQNKIAVKKSKDSHTLIYALKRAFLPYRKMAVRYTVLKKLPVLLPFCWFVRLIDMVFSRKTHIAVAELKMSNSITNEDLKALKEMRERLGL